MFLGLTVKIGDKLPRLLVSAAQEQGGESVLHTAEKAVVGNAVLQLPPCQHDAAMGSRIEGRLTAGTAPSLYRVEGTALLAQCPLPFREQHGEEGHVVI